MSRWLQNVGTFLEKLDDQAEKVAEDRVMDDNNTGGLPGGVPEDVQVQSILTARGLSQHENDDEEEQQQQQRGVQEAARSNEALSDFPDEDDFFKKESPPPQQPLEEEAEKADSEADPNKAAPPSKMESQSSTLVEPPSSTASDPEAIVEEAEMAAAETSETEPNSATSPTTTTSKTKSPVEQPMELKTPDKAPTLTSTGTDDAVAAASNAAAPTTSATTPNTTNYAALRETQKEARTLRRHVVSLNKQLEHAETELQAQRVELERAAERLEKDRVRHKEDREKEKTRHADEVKALKAQSEKTMKELKQRSDKQIEEVRKQLRDVEERRMQEGGDWSNELKDAVHREQEMASKFADLEDEKSTLLSQIAILQDQQEALGNRIESLSQTADNAMDRERESETRLDEALNLHARQIAQRQARESELERTVAELGSALVAARSKANANGGSGSSRHLRPPSDNDNNDGETAEARVQSLEQDMDGMVAQLQFEKERCETLQNELKDVSKERTEEASANHSRQIKHDRQVAELSHTIARLEADLRSGKSGDASAAAHVDQDLAKQMRELSEEVLRQREKLANSNSEISALKSRLKVANDRVQTAEAALEAAESRSQDEGDWRDVERAPTSGNGTMMMRRRGGGGGKRMRNRPKEESMRSALNLPHGQSSEQIGRALDGVDAFLVSSGKFLRYNPLARLLFIAYLLLLHVWTFVLIILHAHGFETVHGDFGAGGGVGHGPHMLMQPNVAQVAAAGSVANAAAAAAEKAPLQPEVAAAAVDSAGHG